MQNIRALDYCQGKCTPTRRALEAGDSAAFLSIVPASSFLCFQAESTFRTLATNSNCWECKICSPPFIIIKSLEVSHEA